MAAKAAALKEQGNVKFKGRLFREAAAFYAQAEKADPKEVVYPSNLSASFYELGDYAACFQAICRATSKTPTTDDSTPLVQRLSTRLAKSLSYGVRSGAITSPDLRKQKVVVERLSRVAENTTSNAELTASWNEWNRVQSETDHVREHASDAKTRLSNLPKFKRAADPGLEYFSIGHDEPMSIAEDWGQDRSEPLKIKSFSQQRLSNLSFLFGGVGDGRHAFGSIIGLHRLYKDLPPVKQKAFKTHLTLLDHNPGVLARDLCILVLLDSLIQKKHDPETQAEIQATLFYTYMGIIMPPYCYRRLQDTIDATITNLQKSPPKVPKWVHIVDEAIPGIINGLRYWQSCKTTKTTQGILQHHKMSEISGLMNLLNPVKQLRVSPLDLANEEAVRIRKEASAIAVSNLPDEEVIRQMVPQVPLDPLPPVSQPAKRKDWIRAARELMLEIMNEANDKEAEDARRVNDEIEVEKKWYAQLRAFMPPSALRSRHEGFDELWQALSDPRSKQSKTNALISKVKSQILTTWQPNVTVCDKIKDRNTGYPDLNRDMMSAVELVKRVNERLVVWHCRDKGSPSFAIVNTFFDHVADGLKALEGRITLEILQGDLMHELAKMRMGTDHSRPSRFPRSYTRMWLSNVPDFTHGVLSMAMYCAPNLETQPDSVTASNCLLNTGAWKDGQQICYNYAHLFPEDAPRLLGCEILEADPWKVVTVRRIQHPIPLHKLASQEELHTWLSRILFSILCPGSMAQNFAGRIYYPNNLVTFIDLLIHLHGVGFPSHWLSGYLTSVLTDTLVSDVAPYVGSLPIPVSERGRRVARRKVNLKPWHADLENILAVSHEALPFPIALPGATSAEDLVTLSVPAPKHLASFVTAANLLIAFFPVMTLVFYKPSEHTAESLAKNMHRVLEGKMGNDDSVQVLTMVDLFDMWNGVIRWRMSKERVKKMKKEQWVMSPCRFDVQEAAISQFFASDSWKEEA
ncbi:hypothetical protein EIP91_005905 [Steccherinum ochraceum]|uniref:DUF4470 domain-containing protein n=1 Tax=Steccherinum ochraceum TaxID=92696 RepID=A0A4R0R938_9APHY|nr:hypothetical protein EIP91_005905 [Steccherinum ochraceum]